MIKYISPILQLVVTIFIGFVLARKTDIAKHTASISIAIVNILIPSVVFRSQYTSKIQLKDYFAYFGSLVLVFLVGLVVTWSICKALRFDEARLKSAMLTAPSNNMGAVGYSIILPFLGEYYGSVAAVAPVLGNLLINISAPMILEAKKGQIKEALKKLAKMPIFYALFAGALFNSLHIELPAYIFEPINQLANSTYPMCLILIGVQLVIPKNIGKRIDILVPCAIKLLVMPIIGFVLLKWIVPIGDPYNVIVFILCGTASASSMVALASRSECAENVATITALDTLLCLATMPMVLYLSEVLFPK